MVRKIFCLLYFASVVLSLIGCQKQAVQKQLYGSATVTVNWAETREAKPLIPLQARSIVVTVSAQNGTVTRTLFKRGEAQTQTIENIPAGEAAFYAEAFASEDGSGQPLERTPVAVANILPHPAPPATVQLIFSGSVLSGTVIDEFTQTSIVGASITITETKTTLQSNERGLFRVPVPVGTLNVTVQKQSCQPKTVTLSIVAGEHKEITVALSRQTARVEGVLEGVDWIQWGEFYCKEGYVVSIAGTSLSAKVNADGTFALDGVPFGTQIFRVYKGHQEKGRLDVRIQEPVTKVTIPVKC